MKVSTDDILDAIRQALAKPADGKCSTAGDIAFKTGLSLAMVRRSLKTVAGQGRLEVFRVYRPDISGRMCLVPAYRIKAK